MEALEQATIKVVAVIAEGVPEKNTKQMIAYARANNKVLIGPATVGGIQVGCGGGSVGCGVQGATVCPKGWPVWLCKGPGVG